MYSICTCVLFLLYNSQYNTGTTWYFQTVHDMRLWLGYTWTFYRLSETTVTFPLDMSGGLFEGADLLFIILCHPSFSHTAVSVNCPHSSIRLCPPPTALTFSQRQRIRERRMRYRRLGDKETKRKGECSRCKRRECDSDTGKEKGKKVIRSKRIWQCDRKKIKKKRKPECERGMDRNNFEKSRVCVCVFNSRGEWWIWGGCPGVQLVSSQAYNSAAQQPAVTHPLFFFKTLWLLCLPYSCVCTVSSVDTH